DRHRRSGCRLSLELHLLRSQDPHESARGSRPRDCHHLFRRWWASRFSGDPRLGAGISANTRGRSPPIDVTRRESKQCDECGSEYFAAASPMAKLCPECAHLLYAYPACIHSFADGRCTSCGWDGSRSTFTAKAPWADVTGESASRIIAEGLSELVNE